MTLKSKIVQKLVNEYFTGFTTNDLFDTLAALPEETKQKLLRGLIKDKAVEVGTGLRNILLKLAEEKASADADRIIAEKTLSDQDLLRLL